MKVMKQENKGFAVTLNLKADNTRNPQQMYQWPTKRTDILQFILKKEPPSVDSVGHGSIKSFLHGL